jgi:hypothetical protein
MLKDTKKDSIKQLPEENKLIKEEQKKRLKEHGFKNWTDFFKWIAIKSPEIKFNAENRASNYSNPEIKPDIYVNIILDLLDLIKPSAEMYEKIKDKK